MKYPGIKFICPTCRHSKEREIELKNIPYRRIFSECPNCNTEFGVEVTLVPKITRTFTIQEVSIEENKMGATGIDGISETK